MPIRHCYRMTAYGRRLHCVQPPRLIVLAAVRMEARALARALRLPSVGARTPRRSELRWASDSDVHGPSQVRVSGDARMPLVELHLVGIGARHLPTNAASPNVAGVIMAGLAGALDPGLRVADLVIDDCPESCLPDIPYHRGRIRASSTLLTTAAAKAAMSRDTGALAVDMESEAARDWAARLGAPFVSVRAISDEAGDPLDPALLRMINEYGSVRPVCVAAALLRHPALLPRLLKVGRDSKRAADRLGEAVAAIVQRWPIHESPSHRSGSSSSQP